MSIDEQVLKKGYRNAWFLTVLATLFILCFFSFTYYLYTPDPPQQWDMDGKSFVPASSAYGQGYFDHGKAGWEDGEVNP